MRNELKDRLQCLYMLQYMQQSCFLPGKFKFLHAVCTRGIYSRKLCYITVMYRRNVSDKRFLLISKLWKLLFFPSLFSQGVYIHINGASVCLISFLLHLKFAQKSFQMEKWRRRTNVFLPPPLDPHRAETIITSLLWTSESSLIIKPIYSDSITAET